MSKYPPLNEQINEFGVYFIFSGRLQKATIQDKNDYSHHILELHHFIKEQEYYKYPERYQYKQKLILLPKQLHKDLHSAMSDKRFFNKYKIERDYLWERHRKVEEL